MLHQQEFELSCGSLFAGLLQRLNDVVQINQAEVEVPLKLLDLVQLLRLLFTRIAVVVVIQAS